MEITKFNATELADRGTQIMTKWPVIIDYSIKVLPYIACNGRRERSPYIACNGRRAFFTSGGTGRCGLWSCRGVCGALVCLLDDVCVGFGTKLCRQIVGVPMGASCAPLVAGLFLFCCERDFMTSLSGVGRAEVVGAFGSASGCLGDLLGVGSPCFEGMFGRVCPPGLWLSRATASDTEAPFLGLRLSVSGGFVSSGVYDKRDDFGFGVVDFPFLDGGVPRSASCGVCVSQLVRFARVSGGVVDFNARNGGLTARLLQRGCRCRGLRGTFSGFYRRRCGLVSKFSIGLGTLLHQGLSGPEFCGDLVYKFKKVVGGAGFSGRFGGVVVRCRRVGCGMDVVRQSACLVFDPITVNNFASLFNCTPVGRASDSMMAPT